MGKEAKSNKKRTDREEYSGLTESENKQKKETGNH